MQFFNIGRQFREVCGPPASSGIQLRLVELYSHIDTVRLRALQLCHHKDHLPRGREREKERGGKGRHTCNAPYIAKDYFPIIPVHRWYTVDSEQLSPGGDHVGGGESITGHGEVIVLVLVLSDDDTTGMLQGHLVQGKPGKWLE